MDKHGYSISIRSLIYVGTYFLCLTTANASPSSIDFTDHKMLMPMDDAWVSQAVEHDKKVGDADLVVTLGQQTFPALREFIADYAKQNDLKIVTEPGSCGVSAKKLRRKVVDIGAYCCPPGKTDRLPGIEFHTIGIAPIALVTRPDNPVENMSLQDARDIFSGNIVSWSEVPASASVLPGVDIRPIARLHCKKRPGHWKGLLDDQDRFGPRVHEVGVIPDMITNVAKDSRSIGYETLYMLDVHKQKGELKALKIDGVHPSDLDRMIDATYPIYRTYNLTSWEGAENSTIVISLIDAVKTHIESMGHQYGIVPASQLKTAGWHFHENELIGEPDGDAVFTERN